MLGILAAILLLGWLLGFFAFNVSTSAIHVLLVLAVIAVAVQFMRGRRV